MPPTNLAVVAGTLARPAEPRFLADGSQIWELDVVVKAEGRPPATVPVSWHDASGEPGGWRAGDEVVVVGAVRRRFYRSGAATLSRTDVLAETVVLGRRRARAAAALDAAVAALGR